MLHRIGKTLYITVTIALLLIAGVFVISLLPIPGNVKLKVVQSGSMEPTIPVGAVVVIWPQERYAVDDIVTFGADTRTHAPTTHRIVAIEEAAGGALVTTKGDANNAPDPKPTPMRDVIGKVVFSAPYLGYLLAFARTKLGFFLLIGVPALMVCIEEMHVIYTEVRRLWGRGKDPRVRPTQERGPMARPPAVPTYIAYERFPIDGVRPRLPTI